MSLQVCAKYLLVPCLHVLLLAKLNVVGSTPVEPSSHTLIVYVSGGTKRFREPFGSRLKSFCWCILTECQQHQLRWPFDVGSAQQVKLFTECTLRGSMYTLTPILSVHSKCTLGSELSFGGQFFCEQPLG